MHTEQPKKLSEYTQAELLDLFADRLKTFPNQIGKRNNQLLSLVHVGLRAGLPDEKMEEDILEGSGNPPLTVAEIRHAIETARTSIERFRPGQRKQEKPPLGPRAKDYVPEMIQKGTNATLDKLAAMSPVPVPEAGLEQTRLFLTTLYEDSALLFVGGQMEAGMLGTNIRTVSDWKTQPSLSGPFLILNKVSGEQGTTLGGKPSYRCGACVSFRKYALVEFDSMTLDQQACFWAGVIATGTLPLRSLVYSGGRSIHAVLDIAAASPEAWRLDMDKLLFAVANPASPPECQADTACRNADRLSRLPGVLRPDTQKMQTLLWVSRSAIGVQE